MSNIVGIDLGTTFSAIAHLNSLGKPEIVPNADGERITPSVAWFDSSDPNRTEVGEQAKNARGFEANRVIAEVKRQMGDKHEVTQTADPEDHEKVDIDGRHFRPEEISALILRKLVNDAALKVGEIDEVVITVPAYFEEAHRKATMDAGEIAGLQVKAIVNEPTAAALFYATQQDIGGKIVVFDLGGGTFDVTVLNVAGTDVEIVSSYGDRHLGGVDFDHCILQLASSEYEKKFGSPLPDNGQDAADNAVRAEQAKLRLSKAEKAPLMVMGSGGPLRIDVSRDHFEQAISTFVTKAEMLVESVLDEAELEPSEIDSVLLVGGSCRIPYVQKRLETIFGFAPTFSGSLVDECVALGAALYSGLRSIKEQSAGVSAGIVAGLKDIKVQEVCNHSYGTVAIIDDEHTGRLELQNSLILEKNMHIPASISKTYFTAQDGQEAINVRITQGEEIDPDRATILFEEDLELPPNRPAGRPIEVTYTYDENQRMHCSFKDVESGREFEVTLSQKDGEGMTQEDVGKSKVSFEAFQIE